MTKAEFLAAIREKIGALPPNDIQKSLEYYAEMIDDRMEDGFSEEEAVREIGDPEEIARQILLDTPLPKLVKATAKPSRALRAWEIVLLILGFPLWGPLLLAAIIVIFSLFIVLFALAIALLAVVFSLLVSGVAGIAAGFAAILFGEAPAALFTIGCGFLLLGISLPLCILGCFVVKAIGKGIKSCILKCKSRLIRKKENS